MKKIFFTTFIILFSVCASAQQSELLNVPFRKKVDIKLNLFNGLIAYGVPSLHTELYFSNRNALNLSNYFFNYDILNNYSEGFGTTLTYRNYFFYNLKDFKFISFFGELGINQTFENSTYFPRNSDFPIYKSEKLIGGKVGFGVKAITKNFVFEYGSGLMYLSDDEVYPNFLLSIGYRIRQ